MSALAQEAPGVWMDAEIREAPGAFCRFLSERAEGLAPVRAALGDSHLFTVARGSSDAVANMFAYAAMKTWRRPVTSLPPSVFSVMGGVNAAGTGAVFFSQSGASSDLVRCAQGLAAAGAPTVAVTNDPASSLAGAVAHGIDIGAGREQAVPATKTVIASLAAAHALVTATREAQEAASRAMAEAGGRAFAQQDRIIAALARAPHVYVIGRGVGMGAAVETALKLKECAALHAEAYSAAEVLHGPLQLVARDLTVLILDCDDPDMTPSLDVSEARFRDAGAAVFRLSCAGEAASVDPLVAAAILLTRLYPVILAVALSLGHDPDQPDALSKITETL